ncbi:adenylosuccinate lyase, partial [Limosilactobacillus fermentum]|nr:adenylosuccinate lyase [Limosilactobacillus fermentum]
MIDRYTRPEMKEIWSDKARYQCWLDVEIAADEAWSKLGYIPAEDVEKIRQNATFTVEGINEIEAVTHHDVIAFTRDVSKSLGPERKWVHYGLTSTDVVDTAQGLQLKKVNDILRQDIQDFMDILADRAREFKYTVCMGRTHGIHAEPTTFGLKLARWYSEMKRNQERFEHAAKGVEAGKISGAVGTFAEVDPQVEAYVCQKLGLRPQEISTQVLPRDLHAEYVAAIALVGT